MVPAAILSRIQKNDPGYREAIMGSLLGHEFMLSFAWHLAANTCLKDLSLSLQGQSLEGIKALVTALKTNIHILAVSCGLVSDFNVSKRGAVAMIYALVQRNNLLHSQGDAHRVANALRAWLQTNILQPLVMAAQNKIDPDTLDLLLAPPLIRDVMTRVENGALSYRSVLPVLIASNPLWAKAEVPSLKESLPYQIYRHLERLKGLERQIYEMRLIKSTCTDEQLEEMDTCLVLSIKRFFWQTDPPGISSEWSDDTESIASQSRGGSPDLSSEESKELKY